MQNKLKIKLLFILLIIIVSISSCGKGTDSYKEIQSQKVQDYKVSLLGESNALKQGSGTLMLEFRRASSNELVSVNHVSTDAVMQMSGMPMAGETSVIPEGKEGRYEVKYNFNMKGNWKFVVSFANGLQVQFILSVT